MFFEVAHEYLVEIVDLLYGKNTEMGKQQVEKWKDMLFEDRVLEVIAAARAL